MRCEQRGGLPLTRLLARGSAGATTPHVWGQAIRQLRWMARRDVVALCGCGRGWWWVVGWRQNPITQGRRATLLHHFPRYCSRFPTLLSAQLTVKKSWSPGSDDIRQPPGPHRETAQKRRATHHEQGPEARGARAAGATGNGGHAPRWHGLRSVPTLPHTESGTTGLGEDSSESPMIGRKSRARATTAEPGRWV